MTAFPYSLEVEFMSAIKHFLIIRASPEKIYKALTTNKGVANWWTVQTEIGSKVGDANIFDFDEQYHNIMEIVDLQPNKKVEWKCLEGDKEWIGTIFTFQIEKQDDHSVLRFTHGKWREETDFFASCNYHWGYYMRSLKLYCEAGEGKPFKGNQ
jgi:uncharacterized protein YndB with AHSA1/START domain